MEWPIIVKMVTQKVTGYRNDPDGPPVTIIHNEGVDKDGHRWTWTSEHTHRLTEAGLWQTQSGAQYDYRLVG